MHITNEWYRLICACLHLSTTFHSFICCVDGNILTFYTRNWMQCTSVKLTDRSKFSDKETKAFIGSHLCTAEWFNFSTWDCKGWATEVVYFQSSQKTPGGKVNHLFWPPQREFERLSTSTRRKRRLSCFTTAWNTGRIRFVRRPARPKILNKNKTINSSQTTCKNL